jgi:phage shock protein E
MRIPRSSWLLLTLALAAPACAPRTSSGTAARELAGAPAPGRVSGAQARALVHGGASLIDVRTPAEFAKGHVAGATNIPYDEIERRHAEVGPASQPVVVYCGSGRRSAIAAATLGKLGFEQVHDLGPMEAWQGQ